MRATCIAAALVALASPALAQVALSRPSLAPDRASILVSVGGSPRPEAAAVAVRDRWAVVARSPSTPLGAQVSIAAVVATQFYDTTGQLRIRFNSPVAAEATEIDVVWLAGRPARVTWKARAPSGGLGFFPVDRREKADVFLSGAWMTGVDAAPLYSLDLVAAAPVLDFSMAGQSWRLTAGGSMKTVDRRSLDPDAYSVAARVALVFPIDLDDAGPYLDLQWDVARVEFSRRDQASNLVTAPGLTLSYAAARSLRADRTIRAALDADLLLGIELGANVQNALVPEGYGAIARLVPSAGIAAVFPGALGLVEIRWSTTYRVRLLLTREPFRDLRDDEQPLAALDRKPRHEWKDELSLKVNPLVSFTITHDYGSAPPAFKILNHRAAVGATIMWAWRK